MTRSGNRASLPITQAHMGRGMREDRCARRGRGYLGPEGGVRATLPSLLFLNDVDAFVVPCGAVDGFSFRLFKCQHAKDQGGTHLAGCHRTSTQDSVPVGLSTVPAARELRVVES